MQGVRALPTLRLDWRSFVWAPLVAVNAIYLGAVVLSVLRTGLVESVTFVGFDWRIITEGSRLAVAGGDPYSLVPYRWSPAAAWLAYPLTMVPWWAWQLAHLGAALAMPTRRLRLLTLLAYPFWYDVLLGNIMVFVMLVAAWALRGSRAGAVVFIALAVLVPRPLMVPLLLWLLWRQPWTRWVFVVVTVAVLVGSAATGLMGEFAIRSIGAPGEMQATYNLAPSALIGWGWVVVGLPLGAWLLWRGRVGLASLAVQPYWIPNYLLIGLEDVDRYVAVSSPRLSRKHPEAPPSKSQIANDSTRRRATDSSNAAASSLDDPKATEPASTASRVSRRSASRAAR